MKKLVTIFLLIGIVLPLWALKEGDPAPFFKIKDLDGKVWKLSRLIAEKKPVLLTFFSIYCPHCRDEMLFLNNINKKYSKDGLVILGICVNVNNTEETLKAYRDTYGLKFPIATDNERLTTALIYGFEGAVPLTFFIDKTGKIKKIKIGFSKELASEFEREIAELVRN